MTQRGSTLYHTRCAFLHFNPKYILCNYIAVIGVGFCLLNVFALVVGRVFRPAILILLFNMYAALLKGFDPVEHVELGSELVTAEAFS